jgi:beta-lactamase regulating signal transducer with metallopeptidase domain
MFESLQPGVSLALIPESALEPSRPLDWEGILCHELAHWRRRDHLAAFLAEILVCVLPWNPLAWWAKTRLSQLAELACDDWVLASGSEGTDYAASLLELVPQRGPSLALTCPASPRH